MNLNESQNWTVIQLGAREHYAIARALHRSGNLHQLVTDLWVPQDARWKLLRGAKAKKLAGRYSDELQQSTVRAFNHQSLLFELSHRVFAQPQWQLIEQRNEWFQHQVLQKIKGTLNENSIVFVYSYAARRILEYCRQVGCKTILGQIDPGLFEEQLVQKSIAKHPAFENSFEQAPDSYWENWKTECQLADVIAVNSHWSREALEETGIESEKIQVLPLAFEPGDDGQPALPAKRKYPAAFTASRPLQVLFLGQAIVRKGIHLLLDSAKALENMPIHFTIVGNLNGLEKLFDRPNITAVGNRPRDEVQKYYRSADVFLFPTLSDGFGLTQLEARHWKLPMVCSRNCAEVVEHDENGWLLESATEKCVTEVLVNLLQSPTTLRRWSEHLSHQRFDLEQLSRKLTQLELQTAHA